MSLIQFTDKGLYCPAGDFYIDPWRPVQRAVITHAHSDHARWGSARYLSHHLSKGMLRQRLGQDIALQTIGWEEPMRIHDVELTLFPAGHIVGSSMVRVAAHDETWLITGDYKLEDDGLSTAWQPVACTHMVTECTFGLPIYQWQPQQQVYNEMCAWVAHNHQQQYTSVFYAYSLGKAQRIQRALAATGLRIWLHGAIANANEALQADGIVLPECHRITTETSKADIEGQIVIAPPSAAGSAWLKKAGRYRDANCSGWMQVRGNKRRNNSDAGFVLSDHADWPSLLQAVQLCGAEKVYSTHGFTDSFSRYLREEKNTWSEAVQTQYGGEEDATETTGGAA